MFYAGPLEVLWHISSREMINVNYMVVGRDPAGIKHPLDKSKDLYDPFDGQKVLELCLKKGLIKTKILTFKVIAWNKVEQNLM
jgi:3'-phosphoadenosine 5'-phosphosulfate synthase